MQRILRTSDEKLWKECLSRLGVEDVYFLPEYLQINESVSEGQAECFVFEDGSGIGLYPYIKRPIDGTDLYDITSAYGFGGYLLSNVTLEEKFNAAFRAHCREAGIVSEFVRFHPLFGNHDLLNDVSLQVENLHATVTACFPNGAADLDGMIGKEARKKIRKAEKNGITVVTGAEDEHYAAFVDLYTRTMNHKHASDFYFFDDNYFQQMKLRLRDHLSLGVAFYGDKMVGGLLIFHGGGFAYNHLSGSDYDHRNLGVNDILQYKAMQWAAERGCKRYLLGGGMSGEDSLFHFKAKFSPGREPYFIGKRIHLPETHKELCRKQISQEKCKPAEFLARNWFPLYRSVPTTKTPSHH